MSIAQNRDTDT